MRVKGRKIYFSPESETGSAAAPGEPITPAPAAAASAAEHVEEAAGQVGQASKEIPTGALHDVLSGIQTTLQDVQKELKAANDARSAAAAAMPAPAPAPAPKPAAAPAVKVETPAAAARTVRRGMRKVKR